jgi:hypothetical protein
VIGVTCTGNPSVGECADGAVCIDSVCKIPLDLGETDCATNAATAYCATGQCDVASNTCKTGVALGDSCDDATMTFCLDPNICDAATKVRVSLAGRRQRLYRSRQCLHCGICVHWHHLQSAVGWKWMRQYGCQLRDGRMHH